MKTIILGVGNVILGDDGVGIHVVKEVKKQENISKLNSFLQLKDNWNDYGAKSFERDLINKCATLVNSLALHYQPDIFPTGRNSIQFEYEKADGSYLEIEIYTDRNELLLVDSVGYEHEDENVAWEDILKQIDEFYA